MYTLLHIFRGYPVDRIGVDLMFDIPALGWWEFLEMTQKEECREFHHIWFKPLSLTEVRIQRRQQ